MSSALRALEKGAAEVKYLLQAGGSLREQEVIDAADEYHMVMALSGIRLFHH